jgi:hypothetical protein
MVANDKPRRFPIRVIPRLDEVGILDQDERTELLEGTIVEKTPVNPPHLAAVNRAPLLFV